MTALPISPILASEQATRQKQLQNIQSFETKGKVSFKQGKNGGNATFQWKQSHDHYNISLIGALGIAAIHIQNNGHEVCLTTSRGEKMKAKSAEQLIKQSLGWDIPVTPLVYWLRGIPAPTPGQASVQAHAHSQEHAQAKASDSTSAPTSEHPHAHSHSTHTASHAASSHKALLDKDDRLVYLEQLGWKIRYQSYMKVSGVELPEKIVLEHGKVKIRFIFKKWTFKTH
jgi:outer membrane lipoprotein LolB